MRGGARLIVIGTLAGSLFLAAVLWKISTDLVLIPNQDSALSSDLYPQGEDFVKKNRVSEGDKENDPQEFAAENCAVSQRYPRKVHRWCGLITHYAKQRDLSPDLIAALILQESGGNPDAYSSSGAVGLMQVMPRDGLAAYFLCVNGPCFKDRPSRAELFNPEFNLKYGTRMLARLHKKHRDLRETLKSYGPMDVGYAYADKVLAIFDAHRQ